jgi:hypothetical protein
MATLPSESCSSEGTLRLYNHPSLSPTKCQVSPASVVDYIYAHFELYDPIPQDKRRCEQRTQKARTPEKGGGRRCASEVDVYCEQRISLANG